ATGGLHHIEVALNGPLQILEISHDERFHVSVEGRRRRPLELAKLGEDFVARRDREPGESLREALLVSRMEEGEEKRDRNGLRPTRSDSSDDLGQVAIRRGPQDPAVGIHPLSEPEAPLPRAWRI